VLGAGPNEEEGERERGWKRRRVATRWPTLSSAPLSPSPISFLRATARKLNSLRFLSSLSNRSPE